MGKTKQDKLKVGQRVWVEFKSRMLANDRSITEYVVMRANDNSAYIVKSENVMKYTRSTKSNTFYELRIIQHTMKPYINLSNGITVNLWFSEKDFYDDIEHNEQYKTIRKHTLELINELTIDELKSLNSIIVDNFK